MRLILTSIGLLALTGCGMFDANDGAAARAVSPDGRNEIRLWTNPLAYEVARDGVVVVARTPIGMKVNGECLKAGTAGVVREEVKSGTLATPVYKKSEICLAAHETTVDFGDWGLRLAARNDGVAYRFETRMSGKITVNGEKATIRVPSAAADAIVYRTQRFGNEGNLPATMTAGEIVTKPGELVYLPFVYSVDGKTVAITDADVRDYPCWYLTRPAGAGDADVSLDSAFQRFPKTKYLADGWRPEREVAANGRWVRIRDYYDWLVQTDGTRTFPWRVFVLADAPKDLCEADIVFALAAPQAPGRDFSWVKPGKVAWDWWNAFYNQGKAGCNTKTYERFIDFAAKTGIEYVILDEGWSDGLDIWKFNPNVDVPHLIDYARRKDVDIILWMTCAQAYGAEEKIAAHFAALGAKGFKVDFLERADAECNNFVEKFAAACANHRMVINYHGSTHPTGLSRKYPNIVNYEGVHGLEYMKFYSGEDFMANDLCVFFGRMTAGLVDYTPGAMDNYPVGRYPVGAEAKRRNMYDNPGSEGTRCHQMAQMIAFEAPLQMLSDSPAKYEKNMACYTFMAATPVVWQDTVGLGGCPRSYAAIARQAKDGSWYAAALNNRDARTISIDTSFLGEGEWRLEVFRDADDSASRPERYVHETGRAVKAGAKLGFDLAPGGGLAARFTKAMILPIRSTPSLDTTAGRNATAIDPGLRKIGCLRPRNVGEVGHSNWTIDGAPVDRFGFCDFDKYCNFLPPLGIDRIRLMTGWARSEREPGKFDVAWLDHIVDWCRAHRIRPLLELSYGNPIYPGAGGAGLADGIPHSEAGLAAWDRWVDFLGAHFKGRVSEWAMWNEPDINKSSNSPAAIAAFNVRSARILRCHMPDCRLHGLSLASNDPEYLKSCILPMGEDAKLFDTFVYHGYADNPDTSYANVERQQRLLAEVAPHARLRQGENGCASEWIDRLALRGHPWTELSQAKWDMRRMLGDLGHDVESGLFCIVDINYQPPTFPTFFCNRKGYLRTNRSNDVIRVKRAYYAVQNVVSLFDASLTRVKAPGFTTADRTVSCYEYRKLGGLPLFVFWSHGSVSLKARDSWSTDAAQVVLRGERPGDSVETRGGTFEWSGAPLRDPVWIDLMTGWVYEIPAHLQIVHSCGITFAEIPLYDSPCVITERAALANLLLP